jgi:outer membrane protein assembly factor BamB
MYAYAVTYDIQYPAGPRCTPTVHDGKVYFLGAEGNLCCLNTTDGKPVWTKSLKEDFGGETPVWGYSGHPLIVNGLLIVITGGKQQTVVALDAGTGALKWKALTNPEPGYSPPTLIEHDGKTQLLVWDTRDLNSLDPQTGKVHWSVPIEVSYKMPVMSPRVVGDKLYASGVEQTAATLKLNGLNPPEVLWRAQPKQAVFTVNSSPFVIGEHIYGANVDGEFVCAKLSNGERVWNSYLPTTGKDLGGRKNRSGTSFVVKNGERYFLFSETGELIIAKLTPEKYDEISRATIIEPTGTAWNRSLVWSHPAFAQKCIFARNDKEIVCVSLSE